MPIVNALFLSSLFLVLIFLFNCMIDEHQTAARLYWRAIYCVVYHIVLFNLSQPFIFFWHAAETFGFIFYVEHFSAQIQ